MSDLSRQMALAEIRAVMKSLPESQYIKPSTFVEICRQWGVHPTELGVNLKEKEDK